MGGVARSTRQLKAIAKYVMIMTEKHLKLNYFVGPYGSGKTTLIKRLRRESKEMWNVCLEDNSLISFIGNPEVRDRESFYIDVTYYKLKKAIDDFYWAHSMCNQIRGILFDGHPLVGLLYARTFFEIEAGKTISFPEWGLLNRQHTRLWKFVKNQGFLNDFNQTIYYLDIPFKENWENVIKRNRPDIGEIDEWYLTNLRRIFHQEIFTLAEYYNTKLVHVKSRAELSELTL